MMQILVGSHAYQVDQGMSLITLKHLIENESFVPAASMRLTTTDGKVLEEHETLSLQDGDELIMSLERPPVGMRAKWRKKRMRRLRRKRRKMRQRAR